MSDLTREAALERVLEAAERRSRELLNQASGYERIQFQSTADETMEKHYQPLRDAIDKLREPAPSPFRQCIAILCAEVIGDNSADKTSYRAALNTLLVVTALQEKKSVKEIRKEILNA